MPYNEQEEKVLWNAVEDEWQFQENGNQDLLEIMKCFCDAAKHAEQTILEYIEEKVTINHKITNLEEKILNLNREKCLLEWDKNEQINQLEKEINELESTIRLLEKAPEELLEAQINWYSTTYPEYFAELEANIPEEKRIEISDFISLLVKKITETKRELSTKEKKTDNLEKELRISSQDLVKKIKDNNLLAKKNSHLLKQVESRPTRKDYKDLLRQKEELIQEINERQQELKKQQNKHQQQQATNQGLKVKNKKKCH